MTDRKTAYQNRERSQEWGEYPVQGVPSPRRGRWAKDGTRRREVDTARVERRLANRARALEVIRAEWPEVDLSASLMAYVPGSGKWSDPLRVAGLAFLVDCRRRRGGDPDRESMEAWSVRHGLKPDWLYRLTQRGGFQSAYRDLVLARDYLAGTDSAAKVHEMAQASDDPRWAIKSVEIGNRAADGLGLGAQAGPVIPEGADWTLTRERAVLAVKGARPVLEAALVEEIGGELQE